MREAADVNHHSLTNSLAQVFVDSLAVFPTLSVTPSLAPSVFALGVASPFPSVHWSFSVIAADLFTAVTGHLLTEWMVGYDTVDHDELQSDRG